jgi:hypothetical protein
MALLGTNAELKGTLGFKGDRGYSAYEIAVKNGFKGTEKQWLASITTVNLADNESVYITQTDNEKEFTLPDEYTPNSVIEVYLDGVRLTNTMYSINEDTGKLVLNNAVVKGTAVEIKVLTLVASETPISDEINETSTNETTAGSKAVYDYVENQVAGINAFIIDNVEEIHADLNAKFDNSNIQALTGSVQNITAGATATTDLNYPSGFTKENTHILSKMCSNNNVYYDSVDLTPTTNGFPVIKMVALLDSVIRVWMTNTNSTTAKIGYYKITLLKK